MGLSVIRIIAKILNAGLRNVYVDVLEIMGKSTGSASKDGPRRRWSDSVNDCPKKERFGCGASEENGA